MTTSTPYTNEHRYDIQWMIDTYGASNLVVDELLGFLSIPLSLSMFHRDLGNMGSERNIKDWVAKMINMYNRNEATVSGENLGVIGTLEPKDLRE